MNPLTQTIDIIREVGGPLATVVLGPAGGAAVTGLATGAKAITEALGPMLGLPETATPVEVEAAVKDNPEAAREAIAKVNADPVALATLSAAISREETARLTAQIAAVQSARDSMVELQRRGSGLAYMQAVVSIIVMGLFGFVIVHAVMVRALPDNQVIMLLIGTLTAAFTGVIGYWLGSSRGSAQKDERLAAIARGR